MDLQQRKHIAESILGQITWQSDGQGSITCPGAHKHSTPGDTATVYISGSPNIQCFHKGCYREVEDVGRQVRFAIIRAERKAGDSENQFVRPPVHPGGKGEFLRDATTDASQAEELVSVKELRRAKIFAAANVPEITDLFAFDPLDWCGASPIPLPKDTQGDDWRLLLNALPMEYRIWVGNLTDSGRPENAANFKPVAEWLKQDKCPAPFICPANFIEGAYQRNEASILSSRFLIVESDTLSKADISAIFRWLAKSWKLMAVVDTGNKSLHGWFQKPDGLSKKDWVFNKAILEGLGCDTAMCKPTQCCRMPGWRREETGKWQSLLYLDSTTNTL